MIVIIFGLPGSGKSFFASRLAERLNAPYINSDRIRGQMGARGKYSDEEKGNVYHRMAETAAEIVGGGKSVVIDATFYRKALRTVFIQLADQSRTRIYFIEVVASLEIIRNRLNNPREDSEADYKVYETVRKSFEKITEPHLVVESTNDNIDDMLDKALMYLQQNNYG